MSKIERLEEIVAYEDSGNPWIKLYFDEVRFPNGKTGHYNRVVESGGKKGVAIIPIAGREVGLVRQYRYPVGEEVWEIPRGFGETADPKKDAIRELLEETGIKASLTQILSLGTLHPNTGILDSEVHLFAAVFEADFPVPDIGESEVNAFSWYETEELETLINSNQIRDAFTISAAYRAVLAGLLP